MLEIIEEEEFVVLKYWTLSAAVVAAASLTASAAAAADVRGVSDSEIVIGSITDLSGPTATSGVNNSQAVRMAFDEVNEKGGINGRKIRFVVEDSQYQVPRAVQALNKMLTVDNIFAMTNSGGTPLINANMQTQIENNVPTLFPLSGARSMYKPYDRLKFNMFASYIDQVRAGVNYFVKEGGKKQICSMYQDTDYGREVYTGVEEQAKAMGLEVVNHTAHKPADTDFNSFLQRLRASRCDLIVLGTAVRDTTLILSTARKMGWSDVTFVGIQPTYDNNIAAAPGGVAEGFYAMSPALYAYADDPRPEVKDFIRRYKERFGVDVSFQGEVGYSSAKLIVAALEKAGKDLTVDSFIAAMESIKNYQDLFQWSPVTFGPNDHDGSSEAFLSTVKNGRWVAVKDHALGY